MAGHFWDIERGKKMCRAKRVVGGFTRDRKKQLAPHEK